MNNLMLDIETLGTDSNSIVVSIGAVFFDPKTGEVGKEFYRVLDYQDQINLGRRPSKDTLQFWFNQCKEAQAVFHQESSRTIDALVDLYYFINDNATVSKVKPWGNGPSFDLSIMESLFKTFNIEVPWKFWNVRCLRTFKEYIYNGKDLTREGVYHHAVDDCKHQIKVVQKGMALKNEPSH